MSAGTLVCKKSSSNTHTGAQYYGPAKCHWYDMGIGCAITQLGNVERAGEGPEIKQGASSKDTSKMHCAILGAVNKYAISNMGTQITQKSETTYNQFRNSYTDFTSNVSSDETTTTDMNFTDTQTIEIQNNMDITIKADLTVGSITDSTYIYQGMDITNNFSFNFKTGPTTLGTRTIQQSGQTSNTKGSQTTTWAGKTGLVSGVSMKATSKNKFVSTMEDTFGKSFGVGIFFIIVFLVLAVLCIYLYSCRRTYLCRNVNGLWCKRCPSSNWFGIRKPGFNSMSTVTRDQEIKSQLYRCSSMIDGMEPDENENETKEETQSNAYRYMVDDLGSLFNELPKDSETMGEWYDKIPNKDVPRIYGVPKEILARGAGVPFKIPGGALTERAEALRT